MNCLSSWSEPDWGSEDHINAKPVPFTPTITATGLTIGWTYTVLRFNSVKALPANGNFILGAWSERTDFLATATSMTVHPAATLMSNSTTFYRCVVTSTRSVMSEHELVVVWFAVATQCTCHGCAAWVPLV